MRNQLPGTHLNSETGNVNIWEPPDSGRMKLNVDASVKEGESHYFVGMVIRNEVGQFVMGRNQKVAGQVNVLEAEAYGVLNALHWIQELQLNQVVIESDSSLVVQALKQQSEYFVKVGNTLEACHSILQNRNDVVFHHVKKQTNRVAHDIVRIPCMLDCFNVFIITPLHRMLEVIVRLSFFLTLVSKKTFRGTQLK